MVGNVFLHIPAMYAACCGRRPHRLVTGKRVKLLPVPADTTKKFIFLGQCGKVCAQEPNQTPEIIVRIVDKMNRVKQFISLEFFPPKDKNEWPTFFKTVERNIFGNKIVTVLLTHVIPNNHPPGEV